VHKANVLRTTTGLFLEICREVAADYPQLEVDDFHIDAMTVHLVRHGADFDVLVTENMFGDILSDLTGELAGSLGIAPSINASHDRAMAQAAHGSAPDSAGRGLANPTAMIASGAMLLDWLGERDAADRVEHALRTTVARGTRTADLGGAAGTAAFTDAVVATLGEPA
jgi:3-isopropylmalate dehydrogenase